MDGPARRGLAGRLPSFPWDALAPYAESARAHPDGIVDLSVGAPVDPTALPAREALAAAANAPAYPAAAGTARLREAIAAWGARRLGADLDPVAVAPTTGSKELVALLPLLLGLGPGDLVVVPELAYPTYEVGARIAGADVAAADGLAALGPARPRLIWVNSPANPTGRVLPAEHLRKVVDWARERDAVVASDECYLELGFDADPVSVLQPSVCGGRHDGLLAVHSLSKRSNMAGYRAGFVAGDPTLVATLVDARRHAGLLVPAPVQAALVAALADDVDLAAQRTLYAVRRGLLREALEEAGFAIEHSDAGLYLWATRGEDCWASVAWLAERGVLVAPGAFYGPKGAQHIRVSLTAIDERVAAAADRLRPDGGRGVHRG